MSSSSATPARAARAVSLACVVVTMTLPLWKRSLPIVGDPAILVLLGVVCVGLLNRGDLSPLKFQSTPRNGWRAWVHIAAVFALVMGLVVGLVFGSLWLLGRKLPISSIDPRYVHFHLFHMCLYAPVVEEVLFRSLLAVAILPSLGDKGTIVIGGVAFALAHVINGNPSPENQIAGFMLMWAFLRSGTIAVPLAMHAVGNFLAVLAQVVNGAVH